MVGRLAATSFFLVGVGLLSGCGSQYDKPIVTYERDSVTAPPMSTAEHQGLYALFAGNDAQPLAAAYLHPGDKFGFQKLEGKIVGVFIDAGETKSVQLDGILWAEYVWKYQGDKKP